MRSIRLLGLAMLSVFAFGVVDAASASAAEGPAGLLFLKGAEEVATISGSAGETQLKDALTARVIKCLKTGVLESKSGLGRHIDLFEEVDLHFSGCKEGKLGCITAGDGKEIILVLVDAHFVALLEGTKLVPGIALLVLNAKLENLPLLITCGVGPIEVKGAVYGKLTLGADVGGGDIEAATLTFPNSLPCDSSDTVCKTILTNEPFLSNFAGKFGGAEEKATATLKITPMVEVDF